MNFLKDMFKKKWWTISATLISVFILLTLINLQNSHIGFLQLHSIDEYIFQGSIRHMLESLLAGHVSGLFGYGFYQYGFIYFLINMLVATPGILTDNYAWAIVAPRFVTSFFAVGSLVYIYKFARLYINNLSSILFTTIFTTMPAFWFNATWFHPDWAMTFFLLACIYYLAKDNWEFSKYFKLAIIAYGFALAFKYQALTALPVLGLYIFYEPLLNFKLSSLIVASKRLGLAIASSAVIFIICNPYILHPMGWNAFSKTFAVNMWSNATNNGSSLTVSLVDKINLATGDFYLNIIFLFILFLNTLWLSWLFLKKTEKNIFSVIAINFLVNFSYLILFVNKAWQIYYLPVMTLGILSLMYVILQTSPKKQTFFLGFICVSQIFIYSSSYIPILTTSRDISGAPYFTSYTVSENIKLDQFLVTNLSNKINKDTHVLVSDFTPFSFNSIGLNYKQVDIIFGALNRNSIDETEYLKGQKKYWGDMKSDKELLTSFSPATLIIIRKNIPYYTNTGLSVVWDKVAYSEANKLIGELYGGNVGYEVLAENELVVIFKKK